jgi:metallo-beta-lactamase class B
VSRFRILFFLGLLLFASASNAALDPDSAAMNQPVAPFKIIGNLYYVGASDITSYLIVTPQGSILLDGGFAETAPQIEANIRTLGFRPEDIKILLNSHAHFDHAGGLAALKRVSHAALDASAEDAALMARGGKDDFFFGDRHPFEPVQTDRILKDGDQVELGGVTLTAHITAGHTKGCTSWSMRVEDGGRPYDVVFICSLSVLAGYQLIDNPKYPHIAADYAHSFDVLKSLPCDVFLGAHGQFFGLQGKIARLKRHESGNPFVDPAGYRAYIDRAEQAFEQDLAAQRQAVPSQAQQ